MGVRNECHIHVRVSRRVRDEMIRAADEDGMNVSQEYRRAVHAWLEARRRKASTEAIGSQIPHEAGPVSRAHEFRTRCATKACNRLTQGALSSRRASG